MKLTAKTYKGTVLLKEEQVSLSEQGRFQQQLEQAFIEVCRQMGISVPMWVSKNTREFVRYKRTSFFPDQFFEPNSFDRFEIRLVDE